MLLGLDHELNPRSRRALKPNFTRHPIERVRQHNELARKYIIPSWYTLKPEDLWNINIPQLLKETSYILATHNDKKLQEAVEVQFAHFIYSSNMIEGDSFDITETIKIVRSLIAGSKVDLLPDLQSIHDNESLNRAIVSRRAVIQHVGAFIYLKEQLFECKNNVPSSVSIKSYQGRHRTCGFTVRNSSNGGRGEEEAYCDPPEKVPENTRSWMARYSTTLNDSDDPVAAASELKIEFLRICPFFDGNGLMSRLLFNILLMNHYPHILVTFGEFRSERSKYRHSVRESIRSQAPGIFSFFALQNAAGSALQQLEGLGPATQLELSDMSRLKADLSLISGRNQEEGLPALGDLSLN
ncbi:hypothetical protein TWF102_009163 [Orbilia oligospora]|uniref:Fido domain-containing protein n=2 Tax=Orbilia oligospora TaxID=2813651 RepID=A0A7C8JJY7_ORBOL|nr:hypothetical protein TWF102_009163 [Orbilia oligospora]